MKRLVFFVNESKTRVVHYNCNEKAVVLFRDKHEESKTRVLSIKRGSFFVTKREENEIESRNGSLRKDPFLKKPHLFLKFAMKKWDRIQKRAMGV